MKVAATSTIVPIPALRARPEAIRPVRVLGTELHFESAFGGRPPSAITSGRLPAGSAEIRRSSDVVSSDGHLVGRVDGFLIDPTHGITHVVLQAGHPWGQREVSIPIGKVCAIVSDRIQLRATCEEIEQFPRVAFGRVDEESGARKAC